MATTIIKTVIQFRRDTTENWLLHKDIIPAAGEPCFDLDLHTLKIGDGITSYEHLNAIGGVNVDVDGKSIVFEDGALQLAGFDAAAVGAQPRKNAEGVIEWVVPSTETVDGLQSTVAGLQSDVSAIQDVLFPAAENGVKPLLTRVESLENKINGSGTDTIDAKIDAKINEFASRVTDDGTINTIQELVTYVSEHGGEVKSIIADITTLQDLVGSTSVQEQISDAFQNSGYITEDEVESTLLANVVKEIAVNGTVLDMVNGRVDVTIPEPTIALKPSDEIDIAEDGTVSIKTVSIDKIVQTEDQVIVFDGGSSAN